MNKGTTIHAADTAAIAALRCPPGCKHADTPETHEVDGDQLGDACVIHEADFGDGSWGAVYQRLDGSGSRTAQP